MVRIFRYKPHPSDFGILANVLKRWSLIGQFVIDNLVELLLGCKGLRKTVIEVECSVGLGQDVESIESEKRYISFRRG